MKRSELRRSPLKAGKPPRRNPARRRKRPRYTEREADRLYSIAVRLRDGRCRARGTDDVTCKGNLQNAHIVSRSYRAVRFVHALCLCAAHHAYYTHKPLEWMDWVDEHYEHAYEQVKRQALDGIGTHRNDHRAIIELLSP